MFLTEELCVPASLGQVQLPSLSGHQPLMEKFLPFERSGLVYLPKIEVGDSLPLTYRSLWSAHQLLSSLTYNFFYLWEGTHICHLPVYSPPEHSGIRQLQPATCLPIPPEIYCPPSLFTFVF